MRKLLVPLLVVIACTVWLRPHRVEGVGQSVVFPLSLSGKVVQTDIALGPGFKPKAHKVNDKILGAILRGDDTTDYSVQFLDILHSDGTGRFYVYFDGRGADGSLILRVGTNPSGTMTTSLQGAVTQDGVFAVAGKYELPMLGPLADVFVTGKMKFAKGTFDPVKISGTVQFVSAAIGEIFALKFKTGPALN